MKPHSTPAFEEQEAEPVKSIKKKKLIIVVLKKEASGHAKVSSKRILQRSDED